MIMVVFYCKYSVGDLSADVNLPPIPSPPFHSLFGGEIGFGIIFRSLTFDEDISIRTAESSLGGQKLQIFDEETVLIVSCMNMNLRQISVVTTQNALVKRLTPL